MNKIFMFFFIIRILLSVEVSSQTKNRNYTARQANQVISDNDDIYISSANEKRHCSAISIGSNHVMTTVSCVLARGRFTRENMPCCPNALAVFHAKMLRGSSHISYFRRIFIHPRYKIWNGEMTNMQYDIAIIQLQEPLAINFLKVPILANFRPKDYASCLLQISRRHSDHGNLSKYVVTLIKEKIYPDFECKLVFTRVLCGGQFDGELEDRGSQLICNGLVHGMFCNRILGHVTRMVYVDLSYSYDWIMSVINGTVYNSKGAIVNIARTLIWTVIGMGLTIFF